MGLYEIELIGPGDVDLPKLQGEPGVVVAGNVKSTPRYGTEFQAWTDGVWESPFHELADTTLSDRFIVECGEGKAVSLTVYPWVEWTAPILEGTVYDETTYQPTPPALIVGGAIAVGLFLTILGII